MKIYRVAIAGILLSVPARADLPVIDAASLFKWVQQAQQMTQTINQLEEQVRTLRNIPQDLIQQTEGLIDQAVSNPLGQVTQNLQTLLRGQGPGSCGNAQVYLTTNTYQPTAGTDFTAQSMQQQINRSSGLQACTQTLMAASQSALQQLPALLQQLQGAQDITQATAIGARINVEIATINAQQQQAQLMAQSGLLQASMTEQQMEQKQRSDADEVIQSTSPGAAPGNVPAVTPFAAPGA